MAWWNDLFDEIEQVDKYVRDRRKVQTYVAAYQHQPELAARLSQWADWAPSLPRTVLMAMAKNNVSPTSGLGKWATYNAEVAMRQRDTPAPQLKPWEEAALTWEERQNGVDNPTADTGRDILGLLSDPARVGELAKSNAAQRQSIYAQDPAKLAQWDESQLARLREGRDPTPEPGGLSGILHDVGDVATTGVRYTGAAASAPIEAVQAGFRGLASSAATAATAGGQSSAANLAAGNFAEARFAAQTVPEQVEFGNFSVTTNAEEAWSPKQIPLYNMIHGDTSGGGFFVSGEALQTAQEAQRTAAAVVLPDGKRSALTPGRALAAAVVDPATDPYHLISGTVDFAVALKADPTNLALGWTSDIRRARKLYAAEGLVGDAVAHADDVSWYHGTPEMLSERPRPVVVDDMGGSMVGPGFYLTDDPEIASSYAARYVSRPQGGPGVYRVGMPDDIKLINIEEPLPDDVMDVIHNWLPEYRADDVEYLQARLVDADGAERAQAIGAVFGGGTSAEGQSALISRLQALGYRGWAHAGGKVIGDKAHNVRVVRDVNDLRVPRTATADDIADAGGFKGMFRNMTHGPTFNQWTASDKAIAAADAIAEQDSIRALRNGLDVPAKYLPALQDASTRDEVFDVLRGGVEGGEIRRVVGYTWTRPFQNARWLSAMPNGHFAPGAHDNNLKQLERLLVTTKADPADIETMMSRMARVENFDDMSDLMFHDVSEIMARKGVEEYGMSEAVADQVTRYFKNSADNQRRMANDEFGDLLTVKGGAVLGDEVVRMRGPAQDVELLNNVIPVPDAREMRKMFSKMRGMRESFPVDFGITAADSLMERVWKPFQLLRGAWTVRVIGEEQIRMAAAGLDSMFSSPLSYMAYVMRKKGDFDINNVAFEDVARDVLGIDTQMADALSMRGESAAISVGKRANERVMYHGWTPWTPRTKGYKAAWADRLSEQSLSPTGREIARALQDPNYTPAGVGRPSPGAEAPMGPTTAGRQVSTATGIDAVKEWFYEGAGQDIRKRLAKARLWEGKSAQILADGNRQGSDAYIDAITTRVRALTMDDGDLTDVIATGKWLDFDPDAAAKAGRKARAFDDELIAKLEQMEADELGPREVMGHDMTAIGKKGFGEKYWDPGIQWGFNMLMTVPTNKLSRSVAFKQFYWRNAEDLLPYMDPETQKQVLRVAGNTRIKIKKPTTSGTMDLETADQIAKGKALDGVRDLLYDVSERGHAMDALRLTFPFGEAWKEVLGRWAKLAYEEPRVVRRLQQGVQGARGAEWLGEKVGGPAGQGLWYTNPDDGQEYFTFPFSQHLTRRMTAQPFPFASVLGMETAPGAPFPMTGRVAGLNIVGQGTPGFGPVFQLPASMLIPDKPIFDPINKLISPYGKLSIAHGAIEAFFPGWAKKWQTNIAPTPEQARIRENATMSSINYYASTGAYDLSTPDGLAHLEADARGLTNSLYFWQGAAQTVSPTAPSYIPKVEGADGKLYDIYVIAQDYQRILAANDGDWASATVEFVERYGSTAYLSLEPRGKREVYGVPTTKQAERWRSSHMGFVNKAPDVYGYFTPQGGDWSFDAYNRALARGDIKPQDARDWLEHANDRVASAIYAKFRAMAGANPDQGQRDWLNEKKTLLADQFEGYDPWKIGGGTNKSREVLIGQLARAVGHKDVKDSPVAQGADLYMQFRDQALAQTAADEGVAVASANLRGDKAAHLRQWLREKGDAIAREFPEFQVLYDDVFFGEIDFTEEELEGVG